LTSQSTTHLLHFSSSSLNQTKDKSCIHWECRNQLTSSNIYFNILVNVLKRKGHACQQDRSNDKWVSVKFILPNTDYQRSTWWFHRKGTTLSFKTTGMQIYTFHLSINICEQIP
jgi:hypothetical protein